MPVIDNAVCRYVTLRTAWDSNAAGALWRVKWANEGINNERNQMSAPSGLDFFVVANRFVFICSEHTSLEHRKSTMSATEYTPDTFKVILKKLVQTPEEFTSEDCAECFRHLCVQGASEAQVRH